MNSKPALSAPAIAAAPAVELSADIRPVADASSMHRLLYLSPLGELAIEGTSEAVYSILFTDLTMPEGWPAVNPFPPASIPEQTVGAEEDLAESILPEPLRQARNQLAEYFRGDRQTFDFPYAFDGTVFQRSVWNELAAVPYAASRSYKDLAIAVGSERAVRAVGSANGRNKLSIVLPCHRIIGTSGKLTGYAGGLWRKEWLLQHEARFART